MAEFHIDCSQFHLRSEEELKTWREDLEAKANEVEADETLEVGRTYVLSAGRTKPRGIYRESALPGPLPNHDPGDEDND
jgi:hypothetical protein